MVTFGRMVRSLALVASLTTTTTTAFSYTTSSIASGMVVKTSSSSRSSSSSSTRLYSAAQVRTTVNADTASSEEAFLKQCQRLCEERNLQLVKVKNARDLASVQNSPVKPGILFRTGRLGDATESDIQLLMQQLHIQTLVDLRSPTELKDDPTLMRPDVFQNFTDILWKEQGRLKDGCLRELAPGQPPVAPKHHKQQQQQHKKKMFWQRDNNNNNNIDVAQQPQPPAQVELIAAAYDVVDDDMDMDDELCGLDCPDPNSTAEGKAAFKQQVSKPLRKERHFVSLMNEFKYVKGTVSKLRKRDMMKAILKSPGAVFSKRLRTSLKKPFLDEINDGGLPMLNELLLRFAAPGIRYVLELCADPARHPVAFYCTAGKDRTGMIAAILLALCGAKPDDIVQDYTLSANVYAEMNDHQAMVGALSQRNLDPKTFLGAPASVMRDTLQAVTEQYGSVEGYCNWIGFGPEQQEQLRRACMKSSTTDTDTTVVAQQQQQQQ